MPPPGADAVNESSMQGNHGHSHKKEQVRRIAPVAVILVILTGAVVGLFSYYAGMGIAATVRNTVYMTVCAVTLAFLFAAAFVRRTLAFDNERHPDRFLFAYAASLAFACAMYFVPFAAWPYAAVFVLLDLFSNEIIGIYASTVLLAFSVLLSGNTSRTALILYLTVGVCAVGLFYGMDRDISLRTVLLPVAGIQAVCTASGYLLFVNSEISAKMIVIPLTNLCVTTFLLFLEARVFVSNVLKKHADRYLDINDPEFSLLQAIRAKNKDEYFRAIHTAYLTERVASASGWNAQAAKTCALYHRIGCLDGTDTVWEEAEPYFKEFEFPPEAVSLLHEFIVKGERAPESGEAACVLMCDTVVASLVYIFKKDQDAKVDYDDMIDRLFAHKTQEGVFSGCRATMRALQDMKALLKKEKLYYDFLR